MLKSHKIRLEPNNKQATQLAQAAGVSRFAYNWALNQWKTQYNKGLKPNEADLRKQLNQIKHTEFPWMGDVTKCAPQEAIRDLGKAYQRFFTKQASYPKFKKKGIRDSFRISSGNFKIENKYIKLPRIGLVKMSETLRFEGRPITATVSKTAGEWFVSISVETTSKEKPIPNQIVGVDWGVREAVDSHNNRSIMPRAYRKSQSKLARAQKELARRQKGSKNREKSKLRVQKIHAKIRNQRQDYIHKLTTNLVENNHIIAIENLRIKNMSKNRRLSKSILDASYYEFRRQLEYKTKEQNTTLIIADQYYPSTQICSKCEVKTKLTLKDRSWVCVHCSATHDRDLNAAINLEKLAVSSTERQNACGREISPTQQSRQTLMKQELNTK